MEIKVSILKNQQEHEYVFCWISFINGLSTCEMSEMSFYQKLFCTDCGIDQLIVFMMNSNIT